MLLILYTVEHFEFAGTLFRVLVISKISRVFDFAI
jgi:hypothetical protein